MGSPLMRRRIALAIGGLVLVVLAVLGWQRVTAPYAVERDDTLALSKIVTAAFTRTSALKVGTLTGIVQATSADTRLRGLLTSDQVMRAPYSVDYSVDLSRLTLADYRWDAANKLLSVRVPEVTVGRANIDEAKMTVRRRGLFITREAFDTMSRQASARAQAIAQAKAAEPAQLAKARDNARAALTQLLRGPLAASGRSDIRVVVVFATEGGPANERWDESRSFASVLGNRN